MQLMYGLDTQICCLLKTAGHLTSVYLCERNTALTPEIKQVQIHDKNNLFIHGNASICDGNYVSSGLLAGSHSSPMGRMNHIRAFPCLGHGIPES